MDQSNESTCQDDQPLSEHVTPNDASDPKPTPEMEVETTAAPEVEEADQAPNELIESDKYLEGLIYPPPEIRTIVDKTAGFIAKNSNPQLFEDKIRQREKSDDRFSFLNPDDAYHAYYRHQIQSIKSGTAIVPQPSSTAPNGASSSAPAQSDPDKPPEPTSLQFLIEPGQMPKINSVDLEIIKLTALFTARLGRKFVSDLSARESRNYQFDFLRPAHSLFGFFNRLVEQYTRVLIPTPESIERLERLAGGKALDAKALSVSQAVEVRKQRTIVGKREVQTEVESRIKWERYKGLELKKKTSEEEKEKREFNEIDWEDFIVVSTVEFTESDEVIDLPPPMSISEVENMTIAQKKMAAMVMEGKDLGTIDEEQLNGSSAANEQEANEMLAEAKRSAEEAKAQAAAEAQANGQEGEEEEDHKAENKQVAEIKKLNTTGMKIRKDYVPKNKQLQTAQQQAQNVKVITTLCQICGQQINVNEISEHVRIELLDPRWKEKKQKTELNRSSSNMLTLGSDVSSSLRDLAKSRLDIFEENVTEEEKQRREAEQKKLKQLAKEKYTWDGHINTGERITNIYQTGANLDEQIQALHRSKGLTGESIHSGPQIGPLPGAMPPPPPPQQTKQALIQQQQQLALQQQQIQQHIQNITNGLTGSGEPIPAHQQPSFGGGATLSAAPQPLSARPPLIDPGRAAMISGGIPPPPHVLGAPPPHVLGGPPPHPLGVPPPVLAPTSTDETGANGIIPAGIPPPSVPAPVVGLPGRPNVPEFGAGIPGPTLTPLEAQIAIDNITGTTRPLPEPTLTEDEPVAKRQKVEELFTEEQWIEMHPEPISITIKLPIYNDKPEWGCDGTEIILEELPITLLVGVLRDKLSALKGIPTGRQQLRLNNKILPVQVTLASLNLKSGDTIALTVKEQRKK
ncbi:hypothetical protein CROQUDRAFT_667447 [Cronartium quercuum f. sp. fusiforme G11]|uniref:Splicing factor 3A subunit 1 n=1 Tax=Cronartium quercuum f. sp. fusiforme G11 TaxID=708437 RepID=A0A9P6NZ19_9BASI|nr:hypothetical protein CROQUDRAFT_667447 [Cronartium quercuum f. sp. fusiforme G11]